MLRVPLSGWQVRSAVAVGGGNGDHARREPRLNITQIVADIDDSLRLYIEFFRGVQERRRMRLRMRRRIPANDAAGPQVEAKQLDERIGQARDLVRDDAPAHAALIQFVEYFADARKERRFEIGRA